MEQVRRLSKVEKNWGKISKAEAKIELKVGKTEVRKCCERSVRKVGKWFGKCKEPKIEREVQKLGKSQGKVEENVDNSTRSFQECDTRLQANNLAWLITGQFQASFLKFILGLNIIFQL